MAGWHTRAIIYQIDTALFYDLNGDGCGDIAGIAAKPSSTSQSICAPGTCAARSAASGNACTTSPMDEVLTMRMRTAGSAGASERRERKQTKQEKGPGSNLSPACARKKRKKGPGSLSFALFFDLLHSDE